MAHRDGVAAVDRAIDVLEAFERAGPNLTLSELAQHTGLVKSTVLRLAASLVRRGLLRREAGGSYRLGPALVRLGARYQAAFELGDHVMPALEALSQATGESASFYVREDDRRVCLHRVNARRHHLLHFVQVGTQFPYGTGASGRVIRAFTDADAPDPDGVREALVAVSTSDRTISDTGAVAAAVLGAAGAFVGAVSLAGPTTRFGTEALPRLRLAVLRAAAEIGGALGGPWDAYRRALDEAEREAVAAASTFAAVRDDTDLAD
jgi:DNA-binding IclR family transcriptional regulator